MLVGNKIKEKENEIFFLGLGKHLELGSGFTLSLLGRIIFKAMG